MTQPSIERKKLSEKISAEIKNDREKMHIYVDAVFDFCPNGFSGFESEVPTITLQKVYERVAENKSKFSNTENADCAG